MFWYIKHFVATMRDIMFSNIAKNGPSFISSEIIVDFYNLFHKTIDFMILRGYCH